MNDWLFVAPGFHVSGIFSSDDLSKSEYFGVDIPVLFRALYRINDNFGVFAQAGPDLNVGLFYNVSVDGSDSYDVLGDTYKRCGVYAILGGGIQIKDNYRIFANYSLGFTDFSKVEGTTYKSNVFAVGVSFGF